MKIPKKIIDRRRAVRIEESLPFKIGSEGYEFEVRTVNISTSGVMCLIDKDIPMMTKLKVAISLPHAHVRAKGVVVRKEKDPLTNQYQLAIFFSDIGDSDYRLLKGFIDQRLKAN